MKKEQKSQVVADLVNYLGQYAHYYVTDIAGLNAEQTAQLRRMCFDGDIKLVVAKNTFFEKALAAADKSDEEIQGILAGPTAIMFTNVGNAPAKLIKDFVKKSGLQKPELKAAYVDECSYIGANQLDTLCKIKSREELLGDIIALLQSPAKNVISALQASAGQKVAGIVKALEERA